MRDEGDISAMRRKVRPTQTGPVLAAMTSQKAMRLAIARAGEKALGCAVALVDMTEARGMPDKLTDDMPIPALVVRLEAANHVRALCVVCPQVVAAVIEAQTMGRVIAAKAADRAPTRTDSMLVAEFLDLFLTGFTVLSAECPVPPMVADFASTGPVADLRTGIMGLQDSEHWHFSASVDFAKGAKTGTLHLIVPAELADAPVASAKGDWGNKLSQAILGCNARLEAVLCRQRLPLSRVKGFAVGDVLRLDTANLDQIALAGSDGRNLLTARLGRSGGVRAVRLHLEGAGPSIFADAAKLLPEGK